MFSRKSDETIGPLIGMEFFGRTTPNNAMKKKWYLIGLDLPLNSFVEKVYK